MIGIRDFLINDIDYLLQTAKNFETKYKSKGISFVSNIEELTQLQKKMQNHELIDKSDFNKVDTFARSLFETQFQSLHFREKDYSNNLIKLYGILQQIIKNNPKALADSIYLRFLEKLEIPKDIIKKCSREIPLSPQEKNVIQEKIELHTSRFRRFNQTIEIIRMAVLEYERVSHNANNNTSVLEIGSLLLLLIINAHSHQYFVENLLVEANSRIPNPYSEMQIHELLSVERTFDQNGKIVNDIRAIRNTVSKGNFTIEKENDDFGIDIRSDIISYDVSLKGTRLHLLKYIHNYIHLIDLQELIIRIALSEALILVIIDIQSKD